jgi:DNA sulfur modification protein DndD
MKFESIKLHNFMRYKGDTEIKFSCDDVKNVTVVLGNNTFGKTTLAQAFRWGLFEELNTTNYTKKKDIVLLNNEVIATMSPESRQTVSVEIAIREGNTQWKFTRSAVFKRKAFGDRDLSVVQDGESKLTMIIIQDGIPGRVINNNGINTGAEEKKYKQGCVQETIENMLPRSLSNYFFFDGERWSDSKTQKSEIKGSINTILGVTGLIEMMKHIKDGQGKTVLKTLRERIKGSGDEYERLQSEIKALDMSIDDYEQKIKDEEAALETSQRERDKLAKDLNDKRQVEEDQKKYAQLEKDIENMENDRKNYYGDVVKLFSGSARFFAGQMLPQVDELLSKVDLEGKDIPGVTVDTVDYLISIGKCLCGADLTEDSEAYKNLMQLRRVIPPEMIGGAAGKFRDLLYDWQYDYRSLVSDIKEKAEDYDAIQDRIYEKKDEKDLLEKKMDRKANVAALRKNYNTWVSLCRSHEQKRNEYIAHRDLAIKNRDSKNQQLDVLSRQNAANESVNRAIAYAEAVYAMADRQLRKKQNGVFEQLNDIIAENFDRMFNDGEKYAKLEDDYRIHVYYHSVGGSRDYEEQNLSNGEATAINFVYIVSVLELARRKAAEEAGEGEMDGGIINLPLVLDGPFSTLSNENTSLVAKKLPEFAEQVIIFMLDKDWASSGLDEFVLPEYCYRVYKEEKSNSSSIEKGGLD